MSSSRIWKNIERNGPILVGLVFLAILLGFVFNFGWFGWALDNLPGAIPTGNNSNEYLYARRWFIASQIINALGCLVAAYYVSTSPAERTDGSPLHKTGNLIAFFLGMICVVQLVLVILPTTYNTFWPAAICFFEYLVFIISDIWGILSHNTNASSNSSNKPLYIFEFPLYFADIPACAVTLLLLGCCYFSHSEHYGSNFSFITGISAAITVLNNFTYTAIQAWICRVEN